MLHLATDAERNVLMDWIVANDIVWSNIISLGDLAVLVIQREVISMERRRRRTNWTGCRWIGRTGGQAGKANEDDDD